VAPLIHERRDTLDPKRGEFFAKGGAAELYGAWKGGRLVGTIAAAEDVPGNRRAAERGETARHCMFGFFEYYDDPTVASALLDAATLWGRRRGLTDLWGPFNFDYENAYGVLVEGRDRPPALLCGHSPPYYLSTMEGLGFRPAHDDNLAFEVRLDRPIPDRERLARIAAVARKRSGYTIRNVDLSRFDEEVDRVHHLLNLSLAHLQGFVPWERSTVVALLSPFKRFADPELTLFAEQGGATVGFFPAIPNLNEALIGLHGLRTPLDWLRLPFAFKRRWRSATIKSVLVPPDHWGAGVAAILFDEMLRRLERRRAEGRGYEWLDLSLTSEENPQTPVLAARFGGRIYKRYRTYTRPIA
jgi:GNAT superfamily N-acetyltransferase